VKAVSIVVIGASRGGLSALKTLLPGLSIGFQKPIAVVLHRDHDHDNDSALPSLFKTVMPLLVSEPNDKETLEAGHIYIAPPDYHLLIERGFLSLSQDEPVNYARPSIDMLFESAAESYGSGVVGVILTGANHDGAVGCMRIKERGGVVLVQEPQEAESKEMPSAAIAATRVDQVLPLSGIAKVLSDLCGVVV
jgi:two-component system chemotaxis response regulator CheB